MSLQFGRGRYCLERWIREDFKQVLVPERGALVYWLYRWGEGLFLGMLLT